MAQPTDAFSISGLEIHLGATPIGAAGDIDGVVTVQVQADGVSTPIESSGTWSGQLSNSPTRYAQSRRQGVAGSGLPRALAGQFQGSYQAAGDVEFAGGMLLHLNGSE